MVLALKRSRCAYIGIAFLIFVILAITHLATVSDETSSALKAKLSSHVSSLFRPGPNFEAYNNTDFLTPPIDHPEVADRMELMKKNGLNISNVAALFETRPVPHLVPLILHQIDQLPDDWPFRIFHNEDNIEMLLSDPKIVQHITTGKITLVSVSIDLSGWDAWILVGAYLTSPGIWENLSPAKKVLFFQSDSVICKASARGIDDFMEYDYIGAPLLEAYAGDRLRPGELWMNGGLSLRNRELMMDLLDDDKYGIENSYKACRDRGEVVAEDAWWSRRMFEIGAHLPSVDVAKIFGVETIYFDKPWSMHAPWKRMGQEDLDKLSEWCPENLFIRG